MKEKQQTTNVKQVEGTPFVVIEQEKKFIIVIGNAVIVPHKFATQRKAIDYVKSKPYDLIINAACYCMSLNIKENESKTKTNKEEEANN